MKITRRQLRKIIAESMPDTVVGTAVAGAGAAATAASTKSFIKNVIKRGLSKSLKRFKKDMSEEEIKKAHRAITSGDDEDIMSGIKMGLIRIDLNDLNDAFQDMKNSASVEYVDMETVEDFLRKIRSAAKK
jgi:hypothetical protein